MKNLFSIHQNDYMVVLNEETVYGTQSFMKFKPEELKFDTYPAPLQTEMTIETQDISGQSTSKLVYLVVDNANTPPFDMSVVVVADTEANRSKPVPNGTKAVLRIAKGQSKVLFHYFKKGESSTILEYAYLYTGSTFSQVAVDAVNTYPMTWTVDDIKFSLDCLNNSFPGYFEPGSCCVVSGITMIAPPKTGSISYAAINASGYVTR